MRMPRRSRRSPTPSSSSRSTSSSRSRPMDAPRLDELGARLGIVLRDPELIDQAFVHSSFFNENADLVAGHNERLEFYGDAVIGVAVSRLLYEAYPEEDEGVLTARLEALAGALSLSEGTERAEAVLEGLFAARLEALAELVGPPKSAKSRLQEWS